MTQALRPHSSSGNGSAGGMVISPIQPLNSSGSDGSSSRYQRITSAVSAKSYRTGPPMIVPCSPMSWQRNVNEVTMPKFPPPPRSAQNRSGWESLAGGDEGAVGQHDVGGQQAVHGEAEPARQVADPAAERQAGHAGGPDEPGRGRHAELHGRVVDVSPGAAGIGADGAPGRVDGRAAQQRQVDDQGAVGDPEPGAAVAAAADGDLRAVAAGEPDAADHVGGVPAARDRRRMLVDHPVVHGARLVVPRISGLDQVTAQRCRQLVVGHGADVG